MKTRCTNELTWRSRSPSGFYVNAITDRKWGRFAQVDRKTVRTIAAIIWMWCLADDGRAQQAMPFYIGHSSCASSTCHGAVIRPDPGWQTSYSVWEAYDPHAQAGVTLLSERSRKMAAILAPESEDSDQAFFRLLQARCVACHLTPSNRSEVVAGELNAAVAVVAGGVSCESCHGPASHWVDRHTSSSWKGPARFEAATGLRDTESWLVRTETCARCHIGSRTADGVVRDMNHDMIAAGHPPFWFDMAVYFRLLPPHWSPSTAEGTTELTELQRHESARWKQLQVAAELSTDRLHDFSTDPSVVLPELADFDCFDCHHGISIQQSTEGRVSTGLPDWNPWYTNRMPIPVVQKNRLQAMARFVIRQHEPVKLDCEALLSGISADARQNALGALEALPRSAPNKSLAEILESGEEIKSRYDAAAWYLEVRAALLDLAATGYDISAMEQELSSMAGLHLNFVGDQGFQSPAQFQWSALEPHRQKLMQQLRFDASDLK